MFRFWSRLFQPPTFIKESPMASEAEIREENRQVRRLQLVVGLVMNVIRQSDLPVEEAQELVADTRAFALRLFPDKAQVYDLIYQPRFQRLLSEKYRII
jgi:hypothetical protein